MAAAAAHAVKNRRKLQDPKHDQKSEAQPEFQTPARHGWGQTAKMLHGEVAEVSRL